MNTVFIVLDTVRKDRISVYNEDVDFTENLEAFAEDAKVFENAVAQAPWTLPSHASIFTGQYPWEHGATQRNLFLETDRKLLAEKFRDNGYDTACYTANTWISPYIGTTQGFDEINNFFGPLPSDLMSSKTRKIWKRLNQGKAKWFKDKIMQLGEKFHWMNLGGGKKTPKVIDKAEEFAEQKDEYLLFLNFMDCHLPYEPPEEYKEKHAPDVDIDQICQKAHDHNGGRDKADFEASRKLYDAEMDYLDDQLGKLFEWFEDNDLMDETAFVILSDHGENLGEDNMFGHQFSVSEQLVSVPMMIKSPNLMNNDVKDQVELRELYDILPWIAGFEAKPSIGTQYAFGGYQYPELDLKNIPEEKHEELGKKLSFVRRKDKKLIRKGEEDFKDTMVDLQKGEEIDIQEDFKQKIEDIGSVESGQMLEEQEEEVKERLEELGYI